MAWDGPYYPPSRPRRAADGIRARSQRGAIGQTWWSQRFIGVLESFHMGARLTRGRSYARSGQVLDIEVAAGLVTARVQGSRARPYQVSIGLRVLSERDWRKAEEAMADQALFLATLLAGEMPQDIEDVFRSCRLSLFPAARSDLVSQCSCPDYANPCKHIAASYYILAEAFDEDPFLILAWRGRSKENLLANLRLLRQDDDVPPEPAAGWAPVAARPLEETLGSFWAAGPSTAELGIHPVAAMVPDALLRQLDPVDLGLGASLAEVLAPAYARMAAGAELLATGQEPATAPVEPPPKPRARKGR
ncbi:MAG TPA: SWIM zinc finger family protein [Actinomycetota bacterium]|nr:SWIM zinc finger family protein [Actinomycetota bacterium]